MNAGLCEPIEDPLRQFIARQKSRSLPSSWASISARATKPTMIASPLWSVTSQALRSRSAWPLTVVTHPIRSHPHS